QRAKRSRNTNGHHDVLLGSGCTTRVGVARLIDFRNGAIATKRTMSARRDRNLAQAIAPTVTSDDATVANVDGGQRRTTQLRHPCSAEPHHGAEPAGFVTIELRSSGNVFEQAAVAGRAAGRDAKYRAFETHRRAVYDWARFEKAGVCGEKFGGEVVRTL